MLHWMCCVISAVIIMLSSVICNFFSPVLSCSICNDSHPAFYVEFYLGKIPVNGELNYVVFFVCLFVCFLPTCYCKKCDC